MSRRILLREVFRTATPLVAVSMAAAVLSGPRLVDVHAAAPKVMSIVALSDAASGLDRFVQLLAANEQPALLDRGFFERAFGIAKPKKPDAVTTASLPDKPSGGLKQIMVADADPYFERWQKDANERPKQENSVRTVKEHPLAAANPGKSVVVCEAGCRGDIDEIVYIAAPVSARPTSALLQVSSSDGNADPANAQPAATSESIPCIAGCYDEPEVPARVTHRHAAAEAAPPARKADAVRLMFARHNISRRKPVLAGTKGIRSHIGYNGAIVETPKRAAKAVQHATKRSTVTPKLLQIAGLRGWRTKVVPFVPPVQRRSGLVRAVKHAKSPAAGKWRTTVRVAPPEISAAIVRYRVTAW